MTLDDAYVSMREAIRRQNEADAALAEAEWQEQRLVESIEARETYWTGVMLQMPDHVRRIHYGSDVTS